MRSVLTFAAILLIVPGLVLCYQLQRARTGIGAPADYLEIEQPRTLESGDPALRDPGIPVLCYHYISARPGPVYVLRVTAAVLFNLPTLDEKNFWSLPEGMFEAHLRWLQENGYSTLSVQELSDIMHGRMDAPEKAVCITFDDGERSVLDLALPLLQKYDMKATLFVVTDKIGRKWNGLNMLSWAEVAELEDSGRMSIESHTHDTHYKVKTEHSGMEPVQVYWAPEDAGMLPEERVARDLRFSRQVLQRNLRTEAKALAWPFGFGNSRLDAIARDAGFESTFSLFPGAAHPGRDSPWHIRRFTITARTTVNLLAEMVGNDVVPDDDLYEPRID
jgi:peptidoglycan/xylan/chitin deacetylase (PgdA/CDA1 family)